jgi:hypothetical protein
MVIPLTTSLLHVQLNKLFKNMVGILALFGLATVLATFQKIGRFCPNHLVTLAPGINCLTLAKNVTIKVAVGGNQPI